MTESLRAFGSLLTASTDDRTLTYRLLPFGEAGRTNRGKIVASKGVLTLLSPEEMQANLEHDATRPVAKFVSLDEADDGINATLRVLSTTAGNDLLVEASEGVRTGISVEIEEPVIKAGALVGGTLTGAGFVTRPAFPSAQLVAADAGELPADGVDAVREALQNALDVLGEAVVPTEPQTPEATPAEDEAAQAADKENNVTTPVTAAAPVGAPAKKTAPKTLLEAAQVAADAFRKGGEGALFAALTNIVHDDGDNDGDGLGEITAAPEWLGEVFRKAPYQRRYIPLAAQGTVTNWRMQGFKYTGTPVVQPYAGNKAEIPTSGITAAPYALIPERWAVGADIDRRFIDFGDQAVLQAWFEFAVNSYLKVTDVDFRDFLITEATEVTPGTVPTGVSPVAAAIVDGALDIISNDLNPTFAIVGSDLYRDYALTPKDQRTEFLSESAGLTEGAVAGFRVLPSSAAAYQSKVLVADGSAVRFRELAGSPIRVEAEHVSHGGKDIGLFGYSANEVLEDDGLVVVDLTPAG
jgi:hypothetical protein